jgi:hypothetical protein
MKVLTIEELQKSFDDIIENLEEPIQITINGVAKAVLQPCATRKKVPFKSKRNQSFPKLDLEDLAQSSGADSTDLIREDRDSRG